MNVLSELRINHGCKQELAASILYTQKIKLSGQKFEIRVNNSKFRRRMRFSPRENASPSMRSPTIPKAIAIVGLWDGGAVMLWVGGIGCDAFCCAETHPTGQSNAQWTSVAAGDGDPNKQSNFRSSEPESTTADSSLGYQSKGAIAPIADSRKAAYGPNKS
jgi:hypothetical protein